jgi:hypothetical protein
VLAFDLHRYFCWIGHFLYNYFFWYFHCNVLLINSFFGDFSYTLLIGLPEMPWWWQLAILMSLCYGFIYCSRNCLMCWSFVDLIICFSSAVWWWDTFTLSFRSTNLRRGRYGWCFVDVTWYVDGSNCCLIFDWALLVPLRSLLWYLQLLSTHVSSRHLIHSDWLPRLYFFIFSKQPADLLEEFHIFLFSFRF